MYGIIIIVKRGHKVQGNEVVNDSVINCVSGVSQLAILYQEHQDSQETDEKLCKWTDANTLKSYEQNLFNNVDKTVADMLNSWQNPVFTAPEKVSSKLIVTHIKPSQWIFLQTRSIS